MEGKGSREASEGPGAGLGSWGATTGTCGAETGGLTTGLLAEALFFSFSDCLSATNSTKKGNIFSIAVTTLSVRSAEVESNWGGTVVGAGGFSS